MPKELKSVRYDINLLRKYSGDEMHKIIEEVSKKLDVNISHIGSYSRKKYPNSIHWHFKENPNEIGCLDATFWEEGNKFWIVARNREPQWVKDKAKQMQLELNKMLYKEEN